MKIRSVLLILVLSTLLPVLLLAVFLTIFFHREQRSAFELRYLERVRAFGLALDRELDAQIHALQILAKSDALQSGDLKKFYEQAARTKEVQTNWTNIILNDPERGVQLINLRVRFGTALGDTTVDRDTLKRVIKTEQPFIPPLLQGRVSGRYATAVIVPVRSAGRIYTLVAVIEPAAWLHFLSSYPIVADATMTLLDQNGIIIARTLNNDRWVGKRVSPGLYEESRKRPEGAYKNIGLEGQLFYTAHSRLTVSGWTIATGVPSEAVEAVLWKSFLAFAIAIIVVAGAALLLAYKFGRQINDSFVTLARSAGALIRGETPLFGFRLGVREASEVGTAFQEAAVQLKSYAAELRQSEQKLRQRADELEKQLIASGRLVSVGEITASMAHEFNNPLGIVIGFAEDLMNSTKSSDPNYQVFKIIHDESTRCAKLVQDMLEFSRPREADFSPTDIGAVVAKSLSFMSARLYKGKIEEVTHIPENLPRVNADPVQMEQVLVNLYLNAIDAMATGGKLIVEVTADEGASNGGNPGVIISVADTGIGIDKTYLPQIFQPFFTANKKSGLGLGLAVTERIIKNHGGRIDVESQTEKGTKFTIHLPTESSRATQDRSGDLDTAM